MRCISLLKLDEMFTDGVHGIRCVGMGRRNSTYRLSYPQAIPLCANILNVARLRFCVIFWISIGRPFSSVARFHRSPVSLGTRSVLHYKAESALFRRIILRQGGQPTGPIASCLVRCFVLHVLKRAPRRFEHRNILNESLQGKMTHVSAALEASIFLGDDWHSI